MNTAFTAVTPEEAAEWETLIAHTLAQIADVREQMRADDIAIAQIKAESAVLKAETQTLREETRAALASLRLAV